MSEQVKDTNALEVANCVPEREQSAGPSAKLPPPRRGYSKRRFPTCNVATEDTIMQEQSRSNNGLQNTSEESSTRCISTSDSSVEDELLIYEHQKPTNPSSHTHASQEKQVEKASLAAFVQIENAQKDESARTEVEEITHERDEHWKPKDAEIFSSHARRDVIEIDDSSDSSDSESSSTVSHENDDSDDGSVSDKSEPNERTPYGPRTKGEITIDDLPPIEDLQISVDENQCKPVGSVSQIVNKIVVIQSLPHTPALNIDTVLFVDRGQRAIGKIFDVFGPVDEPFYCIRFNSAEHVADKKITKEQMVYCAPDTEHTSYIHTAELMKNRGSDASWMDNNEPPVSYLDFSDDEEEARHKRSMKKRNADSKRDARGDDEFVKKMNQRNLELTAKRRKEDEAKHKRGSSSRRPINNASSHNENGHGFAAHPQPYAPISEGYRVKSRTFTNSEQPSRPAQYYNLVTTAAAAAVSTPPHLPKFDAPVRSGNFMYGGYSGPPPPPPPTTAYAFSPQPHYSYVCAPRPLPGAPPPQNYLTMYTHASIPSQAVMGPPFSNFTPSAMTTIPSYPTQPPLPPPRLSAAAMLPPMPPSFTTYAPLRAAPLPSTVPPQATTYFHCADGAHQTAPGLIHMNVNSPFHPQFVLPPSIPSQQSQHHQRGDAAMAACPERRLQQQHPSTNSFYPTPRYKS